MFSRKKLFGRTAGHCDQVSMFVCKENILPLHRNYTELRQGNLACNVTGEISGKKHIPPTGIPPPRAGLTQQTACGVIAPGKYRWRWHLVIAAGANGGMRTGNQLRGLCAELLQQGIDRRAIGLAG